ncbi:MAG: GntR family transcriptional regulator [Planctomycetes bacterium]|nr:GntR family transcriptional regulator [Planctomycetota bacterium]
MTTVDVLEQRTLVDQLVERIFEWIVAGKIERGARITEEALAHEFGVSRTPIREAVRRLDTIRGKGARLLLG